MALRLHIIGAGPPWREARRKGADEENPRGQEEVLRREYSRVDIYVPFEFRAIAPEEREHIRARVSGNAPGAELRPLPDLGEHDQIFSEWLKMLSAKLDTIIRLITLQKEGYFGLTPKAVNISGGGLSFSAPQGIALGEILEIKMMLTLQQPIAIALYGEVVKSEARGAATSSLAAMSKWMRPSGTRLSGSSSNGKEKSSGKKRRVGVHVCDCRDRVSSSLP
jgi:hypothetical protein